MSLPSLETTAPLWEAYIKILLLLERILVHVECDLKQTYAFCHFEEHCITKNICMALYLNLIVQVI